MNPALKCREPDPIIRAWPPEEHPMQRLHTNGPCALSDAELLSIMLRTGAKDKSAVELARDMIAAHGSLRAVLESTGTHDATFPPLSMEARARLQATTEICRRALREQLARASALSSPTAVRDYLRLHFGGMEHEAFVVMLLNGQHCAIGCVELFRGTLTQTSVYPREVVKLALKRNAAAVIFAHNHPSGVAEPSQADELLTRTLKQALALVDVQVLDHFIIAGNATLSFAERGLL